MNPVKTPAIVDRTERSVNPGLLVALMVCLFAVTVAFFFLPVMKLAVATDLFPSLRGRYGFSLEDSLGVSLMLGVGLGLLGWFGQFCSKRLSDNVAQTNEIIEEQKAGKQKKPE